MIRFVLGSFVLGAFVLEGFCPYTLMHILCGDDAVETTFPVSSQVSRMAASLNKRAP